MQTFRYKRLFEAETFDMTPIIDVVFLLIIFFMLVAQFIVAEQYKVKVPDEIATAHTQDTQEDRPLTITVMPDQEQGVVCAVGLFCGLFCGWLCGLSVSPLNTSIPISR